MGLQEYQNKRHFARTPEPAGKKSTKKGRSFVVQKHDARNLHYDFRLELDGVLKSWAVPKGPSLDHNIKRLAVQVEDHPIEYGSFEGIIPKGEYGGGTVMVWDRGTWEPLGDTQEDFKTGRLKFKLNGEKLRGNWMLLRTNRSQGESSKPQWLLFKERDSESQPSEKGDVLLESSRSVLTGRSLAEIASEQEDVWSSKLGKATQSSNKPVKRRKLQIPKDLTTSMEKYDTKNQEFAGVRLTSPEKMLYPEDAISKLELAAYYQMVSKWMLPHLTDRPIVLVRCPEGRHEESFYQKHPAPGSPESLRQIPIKGKEKTEKYFVVADVKGLISLAQVAALEVHAWGSRSDKLDYPDRLIFDLDPDTELPWKIVIESAHQVRGLLEELGLKSFVKTTGGKGLHIVIPIERRHNWEEVKSFCRQVAHLIVKYDPRHFIANMSKVQRHGKIYIDYLRNARDATAVAAYSPRVRSNASVSVPVSWKELGKIPSSSHYTIRNLPKRLAKLKRDPWQEIAHIRQGLVNPIKTLALIQKNRN
ncbi:MAG: non-homologous end-joining DNA ligase [Planctomycetia bacterium]|nr:non-homologous end-joining DNA ligase [Planctomycetia bacterium]